MHAEDKIVLSDEILCDHVTGKYYEITQKEINLRVYMCLP